ncbi:MAG TPA: oxidoreductase [Chitinophagaceae bacterium]|nr:oxidoreductase [Chitinophagaceae bacterium]
MNKQFNVGLIGFGMAGRLFHAPFISAVPGLQLRKIRETKQPNIDIINHRYPAVQVVKESSEILADESIDLVVIATPNRTHFQLAKEALSAGKHVLVDKPFTVRSSEADELISLAKEKQRLLTVFQSRRWDSDFKTIQKVIGSGLLGKVAEYEAHYDRFRNTLRPGTWKEDGDLGTGVLYDLGSHLLDQVLVLFGLPTAITAQLRAQREGSRIVDNFELILEYPQLKATVKGGMLVKEPLPRYIVLGNNGSFVKYGIDVQEEALIAGLTPENTLNWGVEPEAIWGILNTEYNGIEFRGKVKSEAGDYRGLYQNVYDALCGNAALEVQPEHSRNIIRIIELAAQSSEEKRTVSCDWY